MLHGPLCVHPHLRIDCVSFTNMMCASSCCDVGEEVDAWLKAWCHSICSTTLHHVMLEGSTSDWWIMACAVTALLQMYPDDNHKPEMALAISDDFEALCSFAPLPQIAHALHTVCCGG